MTGDEIQRLERELERAIAEALDRLEGEWREYSAAAADRATRHLMAKAAGAVFEARVRASK